MATRVADTLKQQNDLKTFPVAYSEDIWIDKNKGEGEKDYADLQELYNEGSLGGSGLPEPEAKDKLLMTAVKQTRADELEWVQVDKSEVGDIPFKGTHDEWDALTDEQKAQYETVIFTDDYGSGDIIDISDEFTCNKASGVVICAFYSKKSKTVTLSVSGEGSFNNTELKITPSAKYRITSQVGFFGGGTARKGALTLHTIFKNDTPIYTVCFEEDTNMETIYVSGIYKVD